MTPIDQTVVDAGRGDCHRACFASLFNLELDQVPNFRLYDVETWFKVYYHMLLAVGYDYEGMGTLETHAGGPRMYPDNCKDGFVIATVASRTLEDCLHAVIMDLDGVVVHDPNPNKAWQGENVIETGKLISWELIAPRNDPYL